MTSNNDYPTKQSDSFFDVLGNTFRLISRSWEAFKLNAQAFILLYVVPTIAVTIGVAILGRAFRDNSFASDLDATKLAAAIVAGIGIAIIACILTIASIVLQLASARGKKLSATDALSSAMSLLPNFIVMAILSALIILGGFVLLILPGFLAIFFLVFASYFLVDKNLRPIDAMRASYEMTKRNWKIVLALIFVQVIIQLPGEIGPIGTLITVGLGIAYLCLPAILYDRMIAPTAKTAKKTAR